MKFFLLDVEFFKYRIMFKGCSRSIKKVLECLCFLNLGIFIWGKDGGMLVLYIKSYRIKIVFLYGILDLLGKCE